VIGGAGVVMSQRMCFMVACARFHYHGRMTAGRVFSLLFCFAFLFCFFVVDIVASHSSFRRSRNGSIRIEISSAPTDAKGCAAAASALILARAMLVKKLANVDAG
jgi:hypothetical protein